MNWKYYTAGGLVVLAFATGRFLTPVKIETKVVEVEKKQTETEKDKHKETTTVTTEKPDGTKTTETKTTEDTTNHRTSDTTKTSDSDTTKTYGGSKTGIYALGGLSGGIPTYGLAVTRQLLGPISVGGWALTNGTIGVSLGLEF